MSLLPAYRKPAPNEVFRQYNPFGPTESTRTWLIGRLKRMAKEEGVPLEVLEPRLAPPPMDPMQRAELNEPAWRWEARVDKWQTEIRERDEMTSDEEEEVSDTEELEHHEDADEVCPWDREEEWYEAQRQEASRLAVTKSPPPAPEPEPADDLQALCAEALDQFGSSGLTPMPEQRGVKRPPPEPPLECAELQSSPESAQCRAPGTPPQSIRAVSYARYEEISWARVDKV